MQEDFLQRMHSIAFRTTQNECLDLPEITEEVRTVELESKAKKLYEQLEQESYASLKSGEVTAPNVLTKLLRLSQVCGGYLTDDNGKLQTVSKSKMGALEDIVDSVLEEDKKLVIMARFKAELDDIQMMLEKKNIEYAVVRGGVDNRPEQVSNFLNNPKCKVFVGQIQAAGLGITLTAASTMCFYSLDFNMSNFDQARARIHRVGQKNNCHYIYLQTKDMVDKKVLKALRNKIDLAKLLVDDYRNGRDPFKNKIAEKFYSEQGYSLSDDACAELRNIFDQAKNSQTFGNGRYVRNVFEKTVNAQALRLNGNLELDTRELMLITGEDVRTIIPELNSLTTKRSVMGFNSNL